MTNGVSWTPTLYLRWNKRPEAPPRTFWSSIAGSGSGCRPIGYRLEQMWVKISDKETKEWRPVPHTEFCEEANSELLMEDKQFWPVVGVV